MASQPQDLQARIALLKRDFPGTLTETIKKVLAGQNYEVARARLHLALVKKQEQHERATQHLNDTEHVQKFESPFSLSSSHKDRLSSASSAMPLRSAPELPSKIPICREIDLNSSIESSHSDKQSSQISSQSSTISSDLLSFYTTSSKPTHSLDTSKHGHNRIKTQLSTKKQPSPFTLSRGTVPVPLPHQANRQPSITDILKKANSSALARQEGGQDSKKRMQAFYDDIDDIPESDSQKVSKVDVEAISSDDDTFMRPKRCSQLSTASALFSSRYSQPIQRNKSSSSSGTNLSHGLSHSSSSKPSKQAPKKIRSHSEQLAPFEPPSKRKQMKPMSSSDLSSHIVNTEDVEDNIGTGNDSRSSDATVILQDEIDSSPKEMMSFSMCSQMDPIVKRQTSRRMICEDSD